MRTARAHEDGPRLGWCWDGRTSWGGVYNQVQQSEEWQLRDHIEPAMIDAVLDLQQRCLEAFAQLD